MGGAPKFRDDEPDVKVSVEVDRDSDYKRREEPDIEPTLDSITALKKRWSNRRRMAWVSLTCMFVVTYFVVFTDVVPIERLTVLKEVITWFYFACISVVGAYMGFTTWASRK